MILNHRARFFFCLAIALLAHALLLGWSAGQTDTPPAANLLEATRATGAAADTPDTSVRAIHNQQGDDTRSQRARAARLSDRAPASDAQAARAGQRTLTRFVMVAERAPDDAKQQSLRPKTTARPPQPARAAQVRTAARDARAAYLGDWQRAIEARGSRRYSRELLQANQPRRLTMAVRIAADGSLREVRVMRASGNPALDDAALAIVRAAAPYPPLDSDLATADGAIGFAYDWVFEPDENEVIDSDG